ncbi:hypothetical protein C5S32_13165 [ANME-1 cluster archaeon GoMg1]|nr:hypothetical protein [ANME-1 cluster archaeon GoMg1]
MVQPRRDKRIFKKNKIRLKSAQKWMTCNDHNYQSNKERNEELKNIKNVLANSDEPDSEHLQNRIANYLHAEYPEEI